MTATQPSASQPDGLAEVLAEHRDCGLNDNPRDLGSGTTGEDVWSCGIRAPFVDDLDRAGDIHLAAAVRAHLAPTAPEPDAVAEDFHDELDDHIAESMRDPEYRAAYDAALRKDALVAMLDEVERRIGEQRFVNLTDSMIAQTITRDLRAELTDPESEGRRDAHHVGGEMHTEALRDALARERTDVLAFAERNGALIRRVEAERDEALAKVAAGLALADEWATWAQTRSTPRIDAFRDAANDLRAALTPDAPSTEAPKDGAP